MDYDVYWDKVVLGMHMDGANNGTTFTDETGKTVTANGGVKTITATKKYGTASAYFDGSGDWLSTPMCDELNMGAGDFTLEFWYYPVTCSLYDRVMQTRDGDLHCGFSIYHNSTTQLNLSLSSTGTSWDVSGITINITQNVWQHIAVVRYSGKIRVYVDGTYTGTETGAAVNLYYNAADTFVIGGQTSGRTPTGYIDDLRITKGAVRYSSNFAPPSEAFASRLPIISGVIRDSSNALAKKLVRLHERASGRLLGQTLSDQTTGEYSFSLASDKEVFVAAYDTSEADIYWDSVTLLMHMDGADNGTTFADDAGNIVVVSGNTCTKTGTKKFGSASAYFDGSGDYMEILYSTAAFDWWTSDFTIEAWVNPVSLAGASYVDSTDTPTLIGNRSASSSSSYWSFGPISSGAVKFKFWSGVQNSFETSASLVSTATQTHIAFVKSGTSLAIYVDGSSAATMTLSVTPQSSSATPLTIGQGNGTAFNTYLDELRITKGVARYTAAFTPPTSAFPSGVSGGTENIVALDRVVPG